MSKLYVIGSGSSGNGYIIECDNERLIVELGVDYNSILQSINYELESVKGVIVSHSHSDHINQSTYNYFHKSGVPIYSCMDVSERYKGVSTFPVNKLIRIGGFLIQPIPVNHNVENYAYIIKHKEFGKLVFATDLSSFPYKIKEVNHWMIEANYSDEVIVSNAMDNTFSQSASVNHLSIEQTLNILKNNFNACTQQIILLHLSNNNSSKSSFIKSVQDELGFMNVHVAESGCVFELNEEEF